MRHVLFISYYFPPSGGPGVQRGLQFVRHLPTFGWQPAVLTVRTEDAAFPEWDEALLTQIPDEVPVLRTPAFNPFAVYAKLMGRQKSTMTIGTLGEANTTQDRLLHWLRANLLVPDARVGWNQAAIRAGLDWIRSHPVDAIITTGPPQSSHLIGRALKRKTGLPWLADFRDPWTDISYYHQLPHSAPVRAWDAHLERAVLTEADVVTMVSPYYLRQMQTKVPQVNPEKFCYLPNGYVPQDQPPASNLRSDTTFILQYTGSLFVNPTGLWQALAELRPQMPALRLRFTGRLDPRTEADIRDHGLGDIFQFEPYVPHEEALQRTQSAAALLLVIEERVGTQGILTGKIFEYLASGRPILGVGPEDGDAHDLLRQMGLPGMISHQNLPALKTELLGLYQRWASGKDLTQDRTSPLEPFTRRALTQQLATHLTRIQPA